MPIKFSTSTTKLSFRNSLLALSLFLFTNAAINADIPGDVPIERNFLRLSDGRWIWLKKIDWHATEIILGKGAKTLKNRIWSEAHESDGNSDQTWDYAFFIKINHNRLVSRDASGNPRIAISTYDIGTNVFRPVMIYAVRNDHLELAGTLALFNLAMDRDLVSVYGNNFGNKIIRWDQTQESLGTKSSGSPSL